MRVCWVTCAILLAGGIYAFDTPVEVSYGETFSLYLRKFTNELHECYLVTPTGDIIDLPTETDTDKFNLRTTDEFGCFVIVDDADSNDSGVWEIHATESTGADVLDTFTISVKQSNVLDLAIQNGDVTWLRAINYTTSPTVEISLSLGRIGHDEECFLRTPESFTTSLDHLDIDDVHVQDKSEFVSCRVTIGPTDSLLLGTWDLCGAYTEDDETRVRCQPGRINWNATGWPTTRHRDFTHNVNFGMTLTPQVRGTGNVQTCHIITPNGEDIVLTDQSTFPGITRAAVNTAAACTVAIGPITSELLGNWTIYATFTGNRGINEVHQPMYLQIFDEDDPYSQAYNVTILETHKFLANLSSTLQVTVNDTGTVQNCYFETPSGQFYDRQNASSQNGVVFVASNNNRDCRITIGPITEAMLGAWRLIGKFHNNGRFNETHLSFYVIREGFIDRTQDVEWLPQIEYSVLRGMNASITLSRTNNEERCYLRTPDGDNINLEDLDIDGIYGYGSSDFVSCGVVLGPMDSSFLGRWALCGSHVRNEIEFARCQPARIIWNNNSTNATFVNEREVDHVVNFGMTLSPVVRGTGNFQTCHVITPTGEDIVVNNRSTYPHLSWVNRGNSFCSIAIRPTNRAMLGDWTLYGRFVGNRGFNEIRQPMYLFLYDDDDPYSQAFNVTMLEDSFFLGSLGRNIEVNVTSSGSINNCYFVTPSGEIFSRNGTASTNGAALVTNNRVECRLNIGPITHDLVGNWQLRGKFLTSGRFNEIRLSFEVILEGLIDQTDNSISWLPQIEYSVLTGNDVSITLSRTIYDEDCFLRTPQDDSISLEELDIEGMKGFGRSDFVSCGVVLETVNPSMLGVWALCGSHTEDGEDLVRCQTARIIWHNNSTNATWFTQPGFNHPVHFGMSLTPMVRGTGNVQTCHVITPNGEDLVVTAQSTYPGIARAGLNNVQFCTVTIGPIRADMDGDWTVYGRFSGVRGFNEIRQPLNLFIFDENNPGSQAYNVTDLPPVTRVVNLFGTTQVVVNGTGVRDNCYFETPSGEVYNMQTVTNQNKATFVNGNARECILSIGPITPEMFGSWRLMGKFSNSGRFNETRLAFEVVEEDPENPIDGGNRTVEILNSQRFDTSIGGRHNVTIQLISRANHESCHVRTPNGLQYQLISGFNISGLQNLTANGLACGITVTVSKDILGDWMLMSREIVSNVPQERRLPFTIYAEVPVEANPAAVTIAEGNDLYIRLTEPTEFYDTCRLLRPGGSQASEYEINEAYTDYCGFIVANISYIDSGDWAIQFEDRIVYRAVTVVSVTARWATEDKYLVWTKDRHVDQLVGPENAVYCRVHNPNDVTVFEGFGRCRIILERATSAHIGRWKMFVGYPGHVIAQEHEFFVDVTKMASKALVTTHVETSISLAQLSCSISTEYDVHACKFRAPSGRVLLANNGVGEDRYMSHGVEVGLESDIERHKCKLYISNPVSEDLGLWRCAVDTVNETYYGFLTVLSPWLVSDPEKAAAIVSVPVLTADKAALVSVQGDAASMSCSIQAAIRYCYFRARNGTVFNVSPGSRGGSIEYVGAGFDAGECGIRVPALQTPDSGAWSCHVGFADTLEPEQRAEFTVQVEESMVATQTLREGNDHMTIEGQVYNRRQLAYCRFVRIDGLGFTQDNIPDNRYTSETSLPEGLCWLAIQSPTILDMHPWTVVAMISGHDEEISRVTGPTFPEAEPEPTHDTTPDPIDPTYVPTHPTLEPTHPTHEPTHPTHEPTHPTHEPTHPTHEPTHPTHEPTHPTEPTPHPPGSDHNNSGASMTVAWILVIVLSIALLFVACLIGPKRNRNWTYKRASYLRDSFRNSIRKQPLPDNTPYSIPTSDPKSFLDKDVTPVVVTQ